MTDDIQPPSDPRAPETRRRPDVDPGRPHPANAFDSFGGYSGQDYHVARERQDAADQGHGRVHGTPAPASPAAPETRTGLPPQAGRRAAIDPETGAVLGSGAGAGGGNPGEDFDDDATAGGGDPRQG